jgi:hypothetical protein
MALNNFFADGQFDPGDRELFPLVQPLEHSKDFFEVLRIDSQAIVSHRKYPDLLGIAGGRNMHLRRSRAVVLDGIANQILEQLNQLPFVSQNEGNGSCVTSAPLSSIAPRRFSSAHSSAASLEISIGLSISSIGKFAAVLAASDQFNPGSDLLGQRSRCASRAIGDYT